MTAHPYVFKIGGVAKVIRGVIDIDWDVDIIARFACVARDAESLEGFDPITVERDDVEIFSGRIETPRIRFGSGGRPMPLSGFDWTARLKDFLTPSQSIADSTTDAALTAILSETDFATSVEGIFEYITALQDWDTSHKMLTTIPTYTNCSIEYALLDVETQDEFADGVTIADFGLSGSNNCFFYDGATERYYIFTREGNDIYYYHSPDGTTWTRVDSGVNSTSIAWSVAWHANKVFLFVYDGANTDFWRGTITDGSGTIGWTVGFDPIENIFANTLRFGPVWDNQGHMWVVAATATGAGYESEDDGATWNLRFSAAADHTLWGLMPEGTDGDMVTFVVDVLGDDLEEWLWDRDAATHSRVADIAATVNDIDSLDAAMNDNYAIVIAWTDGGFSYHAYRSASATWVVADLGLNPNNDYITVSCDGGLCSYVYINAIVGFRALKFENGVLDTTFSDATVPWNTAGLRVGGTRCWGQDGLLGAGIGCGTDADGDGWFFLFDPTGIRLNRGDTAGNFLTDTVNASGSMVSWGILTADGIGISNGVDVLWDITDAAAVVLADDQTAPFDLDIAGVSETETAIKIQGFLDDNGTDPYVYEFDITEKTDNVSIDTDYEDTYTGVMRLAVLAGAEVYVTYDGTTWTVVFTTQRGSNKTNTVTLKTATTSDAPDTWANIKALDKLFDWGSYANVIFLTGGTDSEGNRITAEVRDNEEIADKGQEYWKRISDDDITTNAMARQRVYQELIQRNSVVLRITASFIDRHVSGQIEIGDTVTLISEWNEGALKISGAHRIVKLNRSWGLDGENVTVEFTNKPKAAQFWNYMKLIDDHGRWITA